MTVAMLAHRLLFATIVEAYLMPAAFAQDDPYCLQCEVPVSKIAPSCSGDETQALLCINDIFAVGNYLSAVKRYCPPEGEKAIEELEKAIPAATKAIRLAAKKTPDATLVSVIEAVLRKRHPCET